MGSTNTTDLLLHSRVSSLDSRKLTIVFGTLGTLITFFALAFAIFTWYRSSHRQGAAQDAAPSEHEMEEGIAASIGGHKSRESASIGKGVI